MRIGTCSWGMLEMAGPGPGIRSRGLALPSLWCRNWKRVNGSNARRSSPPLRSFLSWPCGHANYHLTCMFLRVGEVERCMYIECNVLRLAQEHLDSSRLAVAMPRFKL